MAGEAQFCTWGNLTSDPELRFIPSGAAVASFTVVHNSRRYNKQTSEWEDQTPIFTRCSAWNSMAENVANTLTKGMRVIVTGTLEGQEWEDRESGAKRTGSQLRVEEVGPSLRFATAQVQKAPQQGQQGGQQPPQQQAGDQGWGQPPQGQQPGWGGPPQGQQQPPAQQGWGAPPQQQGGGWNQPPSDEIPF